MRVSGFTRAGVVSDVGGIHSVAGIEVDVCPGDALDIVQLLAHLGYAGDFTHHAGNGQLGDRFLGASRPVHVDEFDRAIVASGGQQGTQYDCP